MRRVLTLIALVAIAMLFLIPTAGADGTVVPGQDKEFGKWDADGNGIPDAGVYVVGHYTSVFAYEGEYGSGDYPQYDWYWDLGDGRVYGTVDSIDDLDDATLTVCNYEINYRADFGNTEYMDTGWILNLINCVGYDTANTGTFNYLIVHEDDPRYTGNGIPVWGTWEYHVLTVAGSGNLVGPRVHSG